MNLELQLFFEPRCCSVLDLSECLVLVGEFFRLQENLNQKNLQRLLVGEAERDNELNIQFRVL